MEIAVDAHTVIGQYSPFCEVFKQILKKNIGCITNDFDAGSSFDATRLVEITIVDRTGQQVITTDVQLLTAWDHTPGMNVDPVTLSRACSRRATEASESIQFYNTAENVTTTLLHSNTSGLSPVVIVPPGRLPPPLVDTSSK
jgi:hypothetical protein